jgi:peptide alpha-N-acetyltransferase
MRDLQGFAETRQKLLALKPSNRSNWISFALAQHANKQYGLAVQASGGS